MIAALRKTSRNPNRLAANLAAGAVVDPARARALGPLVVAAAARCARSGEILRASAAILALSGATGSKAPGTAEGGAGGSGS